MGTDLLWSNLHVVTTQNAVALVTQKSQQSKSACFRVKKCYYYSNKVVLDTCVCVK